MSQTTQSPTKTKPKASTAQQHDKRQLKQPSYKSFRLSRRIKHPAPKLPGALKLTRRAVEHVWSYKGVWFSILGIFALTQVLLVQGALGGSVQEFSETLNILYQDISSSAMSLAVLSYVVSTTGQATTESGGVYQIILVLITSLALIWALRQTMADVRVNVRDAFYKGMYPLVPFVLVLLVMGLQLIPMLVGAWLYQVVVSSGAAVTLAEQMFWVLIWGLFALLTFYMLCSSVFAAYIVTLPDMTPLRALRSARGLVRHRRLAIVWRIIAFFLLASIVATAVILPVVFVIPVIATWVFYAVGILVIGLFHTYMYGLYRELLNDA